MNPQKSTVASSPQAAPVFGAQPISRFLVISLLKAALDYGETQFARRLALSWLTVFPGDLQISLLHAQALIQFQAQGIEKGAAGYQQALPILDAICQTDPENVEALETQVRCRRAARLNIPQETLGDLLALEGKTSKKDAAPAWSRLLRQSRQALACGQIEIAEQLVHQVLLAEPATPLSSLIHLQVESQRGLPVQSIRSLAELYHERWPNCIQFTLILAKTLMDLGESDRGVELLHQAVTLDVSGQVAQRLWGDEHPYRTLWPDPLESILPQDLALPPDVAACMGWNQLPASVSPAEVTPQNLEPSADMAAHALPSKSATNVDEVKETSPDDIKSPFFELASDTLEPAKPEKSEPDQPVTSEPALEQLGRKPRIQTHVPEALRSIQDELERVALNLKQPHLAKGDGRFPVYVILSSRQALETQYGKQGAQAVHKAMLNLVEAILARKEWGALLFYADEGGASSDARGATLPASLGIKPARPGDPWSLKLALVDLDLTLGKKGEMLGALLIVGGPEIIPFHHLPNPVDDVDTDVPSDNPYGTRDENYFIPEWPVGRLPGGASQDVQPLLNAVYEATLRHSQASQRKPWYARWWEILFNRFRPGAARFKPSLGYTAAIWRQASLNVFQPIGEARGMLVSPPTQVKTGAESLFPVGADGHFSPLINRLTLADVALGPARLAYFNLHGMSDAIEWFGQCDPHDPTPGPDYPVALRPQDLLNPNQPNNGSNDGKTESMPAVVFSEACYGAHITGKTMEQAIALQFLACGTQAIAGSTCTAYGSISAPLAAADLLGYAFWTYLTEGYTAGEALRRAKINLAREMHRRQGYLDGEDQKTLISFVLYGDPLSQAQSSGRMAKSVFRTLKPPAQVKTVCDRCEETVDSQPLAPEVMDYVKHVVSQYLPGMADASLALTQEHSSCHSEAHSCPTAQMGSKAVPSQPPERRVVTLSKQVQKGSGLHRHYARLTLDAQGKLVKLVVSR
jgi:tetratricopeptide (TPR) repeat protein